MISLLVSDFQKISVSAPSILKHLLVLAYWGRNFSFVFWENCKNLKALSKLTDLVDKGSKLCFKNAFWIFNFKSSICSRSSHVLYFEPSSSPCYYFCQPCFGINFWKLGVGKKTRDFNVCPWTDSIFDLNPVCYCQHFWPHFFVRSQRPVLDYIILTFFKFFSRVTEPPPPMWPLPTPRG